MGTFNDPCQLNHLFLKVFPDDFPSTTLAGFVSFFTRERTNETMYSPEAAVMGGCGVAKQPRIGAS